MAASMSNRRLGIPRIGPLVMEMNASSAQISITDIANWEAQHGHVPLGAIVAVRRMETIHRSIADSFPLSDDVRQPAKKR